jgi:hypothetical protein
MLERFVLALRERRLERRYRPYFEEADREELDKLFAEWDMEHRPLVEERRLLDQGIILRKAARLHIPRPAMNKENWDRSQIVADRYLLKTTAMRGFAPHLRLAVARSGRSNPSGREADGPPEADDDLAVLRALDAPR